MNTSALSRPFDDQSSERVRIEAESVATLIAAIESERVELVSSEYLAFEIGQNPNPDTARKVASIVGLASRSVEVSPTLVTRARELESHGLRGLDALHVASAEALAADLLVTTDERLLRRARRAGSRIRTRVVPPGEAVTMLLERGR